ncbi:calmodulin-binding receptor-like cytoplasmic kinase 3 isoform X2 [Prunus dulcis]|uniref:calmodulin-binding receptor-like cytoplasmic kinase 3 isoform X2 n=1 Tax=Prunus dulcis TaxID=3755 RepID=UPI0014824BA8|nr:calmodulin-binding receptor-like cytoplasmic kinase 3 isoform X2 [Prunus dulcis]
MFHHLFIQKMEIEHIIPLRTAITMLSLLLLVKLPAISSSGVVIQSKVCSDHFAYSKSYGHELYYINGNSVEKALFCTALETYYANGCILEGYLGINYCVSDLSLVDSASSFEVNSAPEKIPASPLRVPPSPRFSISPKLSRLGSVHLSLSQIAKATRNFSQSQQVGEGGFGTVYKARLDDGQLVSIKRAKKEHFENLETEFSSEVELLAKIDHRNLVKLLGYVDEGNERLIITEYVPNGTLREHLDGQHGKILEFNQRLEIAIDVAHALTYLHLYAEKQIIHRDVKSSNILLTESMRAKVADFGFARLGPMDSEQTHISTKVKGTVGYLDPEYMKTYQLTPKSDVYSFGILLIEIITGRRPVELKRSVEERVTLRWAFKKLNEGRTVELVDPALEKVVDAEVVVKIFDLAIQCAAPVRADRPDMKSVGEQLWTIRADYLRSVKKG